MIFEGAKIKEQGVTFGVLIVKPRVLNDPAQQSEMRRFGVQAWGQVPVVLMAQASDGTPTYSGRRDLVQFLANIDFRRIPWKRWTMA